MTVKIQASVYGDWIQVINDDTGEVLAEDRVLSTFDLQSVFQQLGHKCSVDMFDPEDC